MLQIQYIYVCMCLIDYIFHISYYFNIKQQISARFSSITHNTNQFKGMWFFHLHTWTDYYLEILYLMYNKPIPKISHVKTLQNLCKMRYKQTIRNKLFKARITLKLGSLISSWLKMHFRKKNQHAWEKILIEGVLHRRPHSIPLSFKTAYLSVFHLKRRTFCGAHLSPLPPEKYLAPISPNKFRCWCRHCCFVGHLFVLNMASSMIEMY